MWQAGLLAPLLLPAAPLRWLEDNLPFPPFRHPGDASPPALNPSCPRCLSKPQRRVTRGEQKSGCENEREGRGGGGGGITCRACGKWRLDLRVPQV